MGIADIGSLFSSSPGVKAARTAGSQQTKFDRKAIGDIKSGATEAQGYQSQALPQWQDIFGQGTAMSPYYMGGLGIGTADQNAAAQNAFMSSIPGQEYQNQLPDIYEAALRRGGLTGQTGQIPIDLTNETMKALNQFYPGWQQALDPYKYLTAGATGEQAVYGAKADIATQKANAIAQMLHGIGATKAGTTANIYGAQTGAGKNSLDALFGIAQLLEAPFTGRSASTPQYQMASAAPTSSDGTPFGWFTGT